MGSLSASSADCAQRRCKSAHPAPVPLPDSKSAIASNCACRSSNPPRANANPPAIRKRNAHQSCGDQESQPARPFRLQCLRCLGDSADMRGEPGQSVPNYGGLLGDWRDDKTRVTANPPAATRSPSVRRRPARNNPTCMTASRAQQPFSFPILSGRRRQRPALQEYALPTLIVNRFQI